MQLHVCDCFAILIFVQNYLAALGTSGVRNIDARCLQSNNTGHIISHTSKYDEGPSTCDRSWGPETPSNVDLSFRCDEDRVVLSWTAKNRCCRRSLGGYLLYINTDIVGAKFGTEKVLIKLQTSSTKTPEQFSYTCLNVSPSVGKIYVTVWALTRKLEKCGKVFTSLSLPQGKIASKCAAEKCVCQTEVYIQPIAGRHQTSVHGQIIIHNMPAGTRISIELVNAKGITQQTWEETWKENQTHISVAAKNLTEDTYYFMVHRSCQSSKKLPFSCGRYVVPVVKSDHVTLNLSNIEFPRIVPYVNEEEVARQDNMLLLVLSCALGFLLIMVAIIVGALRYYHGTHGRKPLNRFVNAQQIHQLLKEDSTRKKIAIIFAKDSLIHTQNVYKLGRDLLKNGLYTTVIDDSTNSGMVRNWIDEGENIPDRFDVILFVLTPLLYDLSHRSVREDATVIEDGLTKHRLPAAILHGLQVKPYYRSGKCPKAFVVTLNKSPKESNSLIKSFLKENKSVLYPKPIFMNDMQKGIRYLIKKIYKNRPIMV